MNINRKNIIDQFNAYAGQYNLEDPKNRLKYEHTYRVAGLCDRIAKSIDLTEEQQDMAWTAGMFHDIGRFEQVLRYHTFIDKDSVNHAELSADILFQDGLVKKFLPDGKEEKLDILEKAVRWHNRLNLPEDRTEEENLYATILRDADKIDILKVNCETPREEIYNLPPEAFTDTRITDEVYEDILNHRPVNRANSKTGIDFIMGHIAFIFDLEYPESLRIIGEQGFLDQLLNVSSTVPETRERLDTVRQIVQKVTSKR